MSDKVRAVLDIRLRHPKHLSEVEQWASVAMALGFPAQSAISVNSIGEHDITVSAYLDQVAKVVEL